MGLPGSSKYSSGFTLVEVLATLTLVAIVLPAAMRGISLAASLASESRKQTEAVILANNLLVELIASNELQFVDISGDFAPEKPGYRWAAEIFTWPETDLEQLTVTVFWTARNSEQSFTLDTLIYTGALP